MNVLYIVIQERLPYVEEGMSPWEVPLALEILWWGQLTNIFFLSCKCGDVERMQANVVHG